MIFLRLQQMSLEINIPQNILHIEDKNLIILTKFETLTIQMQYKKEILH
jgi:hypothetical protein